MSCISKSSINKNLIQFSIETNGFTLKNRRLIKEWLSKVAQLHHCKPGNLTFIFVDDEQLLEMNKQYLQHDYYTDIITFDYSELPIVSGDLFISIDRVHENAKTLEISFIDELHRVMVHGVLHLIGFSDKGKKAEQVMRTKEEEALKMRDCLLIT